MDIYICPECGKETNDNLNVCCFCGAPIEKDIQIQCPECSSTISSREKICPNCGLPMELSDVDKSKCHFENNDEKKGVIKYKFIDGKWKNAIRDKIKKPKYVSFLLFIFTIIFSIFAVQIRFGKDYKICKYNVSYYSTYADECYDSYVENYKIAQSYGSGFFYDNYKYISDTYWDLTQEAEEKISKNQDEIKK